MGDSSNLGLTPARTQPSILSSSLAKEEINIHPRGSLDLHTGEREREERRPPQHKYASASNRLLFFVMSILFHLVQGVSISDLVRKFV